MELSTLFSSKRTGKSNNFPDGVRSEYQRDFDRLIFSSAFRRLQNKTQVFPLPGSAFVHNRLTHSLEVSTVGRSIGKIVGVQLAKSYQLKPEVSECYQYELPNVIAAACLAHDIGNPAFGHSGEKAISNYFITQPDLESLFTPAEWMDLTTFEGNANAFRLLTRQFHGKMPGGQKLTYATLAAILKYPCESTASDKNYKHLKKYGFFQAEKNVFLEVAKEFDLIQESETPLAFKRHPFVFLLEAADDITYTIIDFEDAHRLGIINHAEIEKCFFRVIECLNRKEDNIADIQKNLQQLTNNNERISYLRSRAINSLLQEASDVFIRNVDSIIKGQWNNTLFDEVKNNCSAVEEIVKISNEKIYNHRSVVELELAGYNVMSELLGLIIPGVLKEAAKRKPIDEKAIRLISAEFGPFDDAKTPYEKCLGVLDFVSGMTDIYATELYRKIKGIEIGKHD